MKQQSKKRPPVHQQPQSKIGYTSNTRTLQSTTNNDTVRRTQSPGVGQSDIATAVSGAVTTELFENVINTEEDYSEDLLPEAAAEMGQGTLYHSLLFCKYTLCIYSWKKLPVYL